MKPTIRFIVSIPKPGNHLIHVKMEILAVGEDAEVEVFLPVWTPGSYLVREYAQFVSKVKAFADDGSQRNVVKSSKSSWVVKTTNTNAIKLEYTLYAGTVNVRYNHVDNTHGFVHGPATFLYLPSRREDPIEVEVTPPFSNWNVFTGLPRLDGAPTTFRADNFDTLYDCPIEVGPHQEYEFEACETPHRFVFWGLNGAPEPRLLDDTKKIVETAAKIFGGSVPYENYTFLTLLTESSYGGLEHKNSTALMFPRTGFREKPLAEGPTVEDDRYYEFLGLVSHEFFHVWNVKRIRPAAFTPIEYQEETYTRDLWTVEGITSYYDELILLRAGLISPRRFLDQVAKEMTRLEQIPGRLQCSLERASYDTWIGLYRPHPHNHNSSVSYYLKGSLISLILDLMIRVDTEGRRSLDDVMVHLWQMYGKDEGYAEGAYEEIVEEIIGHEVGSFFNDFIRGTEEPDWSEWFENMGLDVERTVPDDAAPHCGFQVDPSNRVKTVDFDGPAATHIAPGDEIVAVDGERLQPNGLNKALRMHGAGAHVKFALFRNGRLINPVVELQPPRADQFKIRLRPELDDATATLLKSWLGTDQIDD